MGFYLPLALPMHGQHGTLGQVRRATRANKDNLLRRPFRSLLQAWLQLALVVVGAAMFVMADRRHRAQRSPAPA